MYNKHNKMFTTNKINTNQNHETFHLHKTDRNKNNTSHT